MKYLMRALSVGACLLWGAGTALAAPALPAPGQDIADELPKTEAELDNNLPTPKTDAKEVTFTIKNLKLDAAELNLDKGELAQILSDSVDREITMAELNKTIEKLTLYARRNGYPAAAAFLPPQESHDGTVIIKIIPGRYGDIKLENKSRLKETVVDGFTAGLDRGSIIRTDKLETTLYSLSDITGTKAVGVLSPGKEFGTSDLTIKITEDKLSSTVVYAENYGSTGTGRYRYGVQETLRNLSGYGDKMNIGALISNGGLRNYYLNYETLVGRGGTTLGMGFSRMDYETGYSQVSGRADTFSLFGGRTVYHQTDKKLRVVYGFDYRKLLDDYTKLVPGTEAEKHSHNFHVGIDGYWRKPGTVITYNAMGTVGRVTADSALAETLMSPQIGDTEGAFAKLNATTTVTQALGHKTELSVKVTGQMANRNLDSSEKFFLGGPSGVRAYPQGEASGDMGLLGTAELKYYTNVPGLVLSTYYDNGHVRLTHDGAGGAVTLSGWGLGLAYSKPGDWFARLDYARRIGSHSRLSQEALARQRLWFLLGKIW